MRKKITFSRRATKRQPSITRSARITLISSVGVALIGLLSGFLGSYVGQRTNAVAEADKMIRENLEISYRKTFSINDLAVDLNMAALPPRIGPDLHRFMTIYNDKSKIFQNSINEIATPTDLYEEDLELPLGNYIRCAREFNVAASELFMLRIELFRNGEFGSPGYNEAAKKYDFGSRQNAVAAKREECERLNNEFRKWIKLAIHKHTPRTILF